MSSAVKRIVMLHTGGVVMNSRHFCSALPNRRAFHPFSVGVIEHQRLGNILFDTGWGSRSADIASSRPFKLMARLARIIYAEHYQLLRQLGAAGYEPAELEHVILSHLHFDHTGGMRDLVSARFYLSEVEYDAAIEYEGLKAFLKGYRPEDFRDLPLEFVEFDQDLKIWPFESGCDLFSDGSVILLPTPGHTAGHMSALVRLASGREVLLAGDAALVRQNFTIPADQGIVTRGIRWDHESTWRTMLKLRALWKARPEIEIIPCHDGRLGRKLKRGPLVLE